jgi:hypothetical protein
VRRPVWIRRPLSFSSRRLVISPTNGTWRVRSDRVDYLGTPSSWCFAHGKNNQRVI